ncbi:MAG: hypothetical protein HY894_05175 [Deltaproteobacteria bacterium]|nr:hypothetical protein [Deltaproteobacteria bacterium]
MKTRIKKLIVAAAVAAAALIAPQWANAANTASGTTISNLATINYKVNAVSQPLIESAPGGNSTPDAGNGTNTTFLVDNKVDLTITEDDAAGTWADTYPGSPTQWQARKYTVTNAGNTTQDYVLSAYADAANNAAFAGTTVALYEDDGGSAGSWDATDTQSVADALTGTGRITNVTANASNTRTIWMVITAPIAVTSGMTANFALKAKTYDITGGPETTDTAGADNPAAVDVVLADADSDVGALDGLHDGDYVAWDDVVGSGGSNKGFKVKSAVLTITKTSAVVWDPINLGVNPKAIPGAIVEYTIAIGNAVGAVTATNVSISDAVGANTTFYAGGYDAGTGLLGIQVIEPDATTTALTNSNADSNETASGIEGNYNAGTVTVTDMTVTANQTATVKFQVTIN